MLSNLLLNYYRPQIRFGYEEADATILYLYAISAGGAGATAESHDSIDGPVSFPTSTWRTISNISISVLVAGFLCTRKVG